MNKIVNDKNAINLLKISTQQKIITFSNETGITIDTLLNALIDDEIERHRLLKISDELSGEEPKTTVASQKIAKICNKHLSVLDHESESLAIRKSIENLHRDLLKQKIIYVNARQGSIVESKILRTARVDYYWYAGVLAKRIALCFGTLEVYLWHQLLYPFSDVLFVGMPTNVEVSYQVFSHLYKLLKKTKAAYKKDAGNWGSKNEMAEEANRYISEFAQELDHIRAYIENDNYDKLLYEYADKKYAYAMRD
jgi:hypothetical protein